MWDAYNVLHAPGSHLLVLEEVPLPLDALGSQSNQKNQPKREIAHAVLLTSKSCSPPYEHVCSQNRSGASKTHLELLLLLILFGVLPNLLSL